MLFLSLARERERERESVCYMSTAKPFALMMMDTFFPFSHFLMEKKL